LIVNFDCSLFCRVLNATIATVGLLEYRKVVAEADIIAMALTGEFLESQVIPTECLRLFVGVRDHLEVSLVVNTQLVVVFDARWELHAVGDVIELHIVFIEVRGILGDVHIVRAVEDLDEFVSIGSLVNNPNLTNLINAIRSSVHAVRNV